MLWRDRLPIWTTGLFAPREPWVNCSIQRSDGLRAILSPHPPRAIPRAPRSITDLSSRERRWGGSLTGRLVSCIHGLWAFGICSVPLRLSATTPATGRLQSCTTSSSVEIPIGSRCPTVAPPLRRTPGMCLPAAGQPPPGPRPRLARPCATHLQGQPCGCRRHPARLLPVCVWHPAGLRLSPRNPIPADQFRHGLAGCDQLPRRSSRRLRRGSRGARLAALPLRLGRYDQSRRFQAGVLGEYFFMRSALCCGHLAPRSSQWFHRRPHVFSRNWRTSHSGCGALSERFADRLHVQKGTA